jgi:RNA polymerase sigma-70 factor, ECF subfamily
LDRSDEELVADCLGGDRSAFAQLVGRHQSRVIAMANRALRDGAQAEDLAQEVFVRAYRSLSRFEPSRRFGPWLMAITANRIRDHYKSRARRNEVPFEVDDLTPGEGSTPADQAAARQVLVRLEAGIGTLPEETREILRLRFMLGYDYEEVAETLSLPLGTIKSRISRARSALRHILGEVV